MALPRDVKKKESTSSMSDQQKENLMNKALASAIIGLLTWNIYTTQALTISMAVLSEKVARIEEIVKN